MLLPPPRPRRRVEVETEKGSARWSRVEEAPEANAGEARQREAAAENSWRCVRRRRRRCPPLAVEVAAAAAAEEEEEEEVVEGGAVAMPVAAGILPTTRTWRHPLKGFA